MEVWPELNLLQGFNAKLDLRLGVTKPGNGNNTCTVRLLWPLWPRKSLCFAYQMTSRILTDI